MEVKRNSGLFIGDVQSGSQPTGTLNITENGQYNVAEYATADVDVPALTTKFEASIADPNKINYCEPITDNLYDLEIPSDVEYTQLSNKCCYANSNVKTVTIGDNITSIVDGYPQDLYSEGSAIDSSAFGYCKNLTDVYGGANIAHIGDLSFMGCDNLSNMSTSFEGGNLKYVGAYAFCGCRRLTGTIKFNKLEEVYANAFNFTQLNNIYIIGTGVISQPQGVFIRDEAFNRVNITGSHYDKIIINTNGGSRLNIGSRVFSGDNNTKVSVLAILSNNISFTAYSFANFHSNIIDFYTHLNQSDFATWLNNLNDATLKNAITNATNIHYEYAGDGSEL